MQAGMTIYMEESNWRYAANVASSLSGLQLIQGDINNAINTAEQSIELAYAGDDDYWQIAARTTLADALHQLGQAEKALALFSEAEELQQQAQPDMPKLQSLWGFRYCDLLLCNNQWQAVKIRCTQTLEWLMQSNNNSSLLDPALDQLSLGKACLQETILSGWTYKNPSDEQQEMMQQAQEWLDKSVAALRNAGTEDHLPRGLLARATLFRHQQQWQAAYADLQETFDIAQRGGMLLHLTDYHLESARLELSQYNKKEVKKYSDAAQQLIKRTGYQRRQAELEMIMSQCKGSLSRQKTRAQLASIV
jgi:tetratricopeptide (TPR) repeat protein